VSNKKWFYNSRPDGSGFVGPFDTREEAILEAQAEYEKRDGFYIGQSHSVGVSVDAECVADQWQNGDAIDRLYDGALDCWCSGVTADQWAACSEELSAVFRKHLKQWGHETEWNVIPEAEIYEELRK
jgi:hypothetical protein